MSIERQLARAETIVDVPRWVGVGLWAAAIVWFGVGDLASTHLAATWNPLAYETTGVVRAVIKRWGIAGHAVLKAVILACGRVYYDRLPEVFGDYPGTDVYRLAIPLGFVAVGLALTLHNITIVL